MSVLASQFGRLTVEKRGDLRHDELHYGTAQRGVEDDAGAKGAEDWRAVFAFALLWSTPDMIVECLTYP